MFTGIVEEVGYIHSLKKFGDGVEFVITAKKIPKTVRVDNSICVNGVCLTVVKRSNYNFTVQAVKETLRKTNLGFLKTGNPVNLERSVRLNDRLGGHIVQGHVDVTGKIVKVITLESSWMFTVAFPKIYRKNLIQVGSITIDGTSLTVAQLSHQQFTVAIIPYTFGHTIFNHYIKGTIVNLEFDIIGKYIESIVKYK
jgi:riboflavin synthase